MVNPSQVCGKEGTIKTECTRIQGQDTIYTEDFQKRAPGLKDKYSKNVGRFNMKTMQNIGSAISPWSYTRMPKLI